MLKIQYPLVHHTHGPNTPRDIHDHDGQVPAHFHLFDTYGVPETCGVALYEAGELPDEDPLASSVWSQLQMVIPIYVEASREFCTLQLWLMKSRHRLAFEAYMQGQCLF